MIRAALWALFLGPAAALAQPATVPEPAQLHGEPYNSPVPATMAGAAQVITTPDAMRLHAEGVPFLDVMPRKKKPDLPEGTIWTEAPHVTIEGATWLYDTGYERVSDVEQDRLADGLAQATKGDKTNPVVIFCKKNCWMSWNAGKRAIELGYTGVIWYPDGADGWSRAGGTMVRARVP